MMKGTIGIFEGDFIGPEIMKEAVKILEAIENKFGHAFEKVYLEASGPAFEKYGTHLPRSSLSMAGKCDAILKGPFGGPPEQLHHPKWSRVEQDAILPLRKHFGLHTNLRETKTIDSLLHLSPLKEDVIKDVDILIVRELISGIYFGEKKERMVDGEREFSDVEAYRESEIRRVAVNAFEFARRRRRKVTLVGKSNVLKSSVLWREVVGDIHQSYRDIVYEYMHVDHASMQLIINPGQFDVILTSNLFGDILSDEASVIPGSIGLHPSASLGDTGFGLYEPIHGSAPGIANRNMANPISAILCVALMLRYSFQLEEEASHIEKSVIGTLDAGYRTQDLFTRRDDPGKLLGTREMGDTIKEFLMKG